MNSLQSDVVVFNLKLIGFKSIDPFETADMNDTEGTVLFLKIHFKQELTSLLSSYQVQVDIN